MITGKILQIMSCFKSSNYTPPLCFAIEPIETIFSSAFSFFCYAIMVTASQLTILQYVIANLIQNVTNSVNVKPDDDNYLNWNFQLELLQPFF